MAKKRNKNEGYILDESEIMSPGDCIGHWEENNKDCDICEIQDSCRDMTLAIDIENKQKKQ